MAYTNAWTNNWLGTNPANTIDNRISQALLDVEERMDNILGDDAWSAGDDPTIDGTILQDIKTLTASSLSGFITKAGNVATLAAGKFLKFAVPHYFGVLSVSSGNYVADGFAHTIPINSIPTNGDPLGIVNNGADKIVIPADAGGLWAFNQTLIIRPLPEVSVGTINIYLTKNTVQLPETTVALSNFGGFLGDGSDVNRTATLSWTSYVPLAAADEIQLAYAIVTGSNGATAAAGYWSGIRLH